MHYDVAAMVEQRRIALMDLDAFFASVEVLEQPALRGKPLLIGGSPQGRGVVAAASYEARVFGCHSAMPMAQALRLCPQAVVLPTRHHLYRAYSGRVMDVLRRETEAVEQVSIDEAYVDMTAATADMAEAAARGRRMQGRVRVEVGLPCSVGLAASKMVAKVACETGKPGGFVLVEPGHEAGFLAPLPVRTLPGIGPRSEEHLHANGLRTLGDIQRAPVSALTSLLGSWGAVLQRRASGEDHSPVEVEREAKSISSEETFEADITDEATLLAHLERMTSEVAGSLQAHGLLARTVTLKLRWPDFTTLTRSVSRTSATNTADALFAAAAQLLAANRRAEQAVRLLGVGASNLRPAHEPGQLSLPLDQDRAG